MAKRAPHQVNPAAARQPGRPPMVPPTANRPFAVLYLHQTKLSSDDLAKLTGVWPLARKRSPAGAGPAVG